MKRKWKVIFACAILLPILFLGAEEAGKRTVAFIQQTAGDVMDLESAKTYMGETGPKLRRLAQQCLKNLDIDKEKLYNTFYETADDLTQVYHFLLRTFAAKDNP